MRKLTFASHFTVFFFGFLVGLIALMVIGLTCAQASVVAPVHQFPVRLWSGTAWVTQTSSTARITAYYGDADTTVATHVHCSYSPSTALWSFVVPVTAVYTVWNQTTHSKVIGSEAVALLGPDLGGTGAGDITAVNIDAAYGAYLLVSNPTGPGAVSLGVNIGSDATAGSFDYRYVNEGQATSVTGAMISAGTPHVGDALKVKSLSPTVAEWGSIAGSGTVLDVTVNGNSTQYLSMGANPTTHPIAEVLPAGFDSRFINVNSETAEIATTAGVTGTGPLTTGSYFMVYSGGGYWTKLYAAATANWSLYLPATATTVTNKALVASSVGTGTVTLGWADLGTGGDITDVTAGTGILVTNPTGPAPSVAIDYTDVSSKYFDQTGEAGPITMTGTNPFTAYSVVGLNNLTAGNATTNAGHMTMYNTGHYSVDLWPSPDATADIDWYLPENNPVYRGVLTGLYGTNKSRWVDGINMTGDIVTTGWMSNHGTMTINAGGYWNKFITYATQNSNLTYNLPTAYPANVTGYLACSNTGNMVWVATTSKMAKTSDINYFDPGRSSNPSFMKAWVDSAWAFGDSAYRANNEDQSFLAIDTTLIPVKTGPVTLDQTLHVLGVATFDDWVVAAGLTDNTSYTIQADSSYIHSPFWMQHNVTIGTSGADKFKVYSAVTMLASMATKGISNTGSITSTQKMVCADSVNAKQSMRIGTPSTTGSLVLWNADGKKLTVNAPSGMAADRTTNMFSFAVSDTFKLKVTRYKGADRKTSKYVPGVLSTDIVQTPAPMHGGGMVYAVEWYAVNDSVGYQWDAALDNEVLPFLILRNANR